jgi:hypothetical protein
MINQHSELDPQSDLYQFAVMTVREQAATMESRGFHSCSGCGHIVTNGEDCLRCEETAREQARRDREQREETDCVENDFVGGFWGEGY